jgi:hypothetical protein
MRDAPSQDVFQSAMQYFKVPLYFSLPQEGLLMSILRTADEVRAAEYDLPQDELDNEMVQLAETRQAKDGRFRPRSGGLRVAIGRDLRIHGLRIQRSSKSRLPVR